MSGTPRTLDLWLDGIGLIAPGMPDWPAAAAVLAGRADWVPAPSVLPAPALLPPAERRRASRVIRLALALGEQAATHAGADVAQLATVFTASGADGHNCHALCEQLAGDDRQVSPTRFHNSVHNAAAGYWGIAARSMQPCQVLCAHDGSFGAGLLDATAQVAADGVRVLLIAYDSEYPEPLHAKRPFPDAAGMAWLLSPARSAASLAQLQLLHGAAQAAPTALADARLDTLRTQYPALRGLPALQRLARGAAGTVVVDYLPGQALALQVQPCPS
ncbi:Beta-ketoacyl synthase, N-terminal domain [Oryzisolibacter propanilivorax]|uniref:Beta-ketoacyl synthase, N-terminal domain n=1 Tax=Oryzisolibacter propanilivorax TaxID=1527607 RepID=A0A1G9QGW0_9BURK|nr:beta-ketoacyl synthase chain length factor [Oryzisolibacter propanilivorax]SDM09727.1 Beta-ketoacyl synthase, N-terminal domain [Oryzisolibacter propanilivorax]